MDDCVEDCVEESVEDCVEESVEDGIEESIAEGRWNAEILWIVLRSSGMLARSTKSPLLSENLKNRAAQNNTSC